MIYNSLYSKGFYKLRDYDLPLVRRLKHLSLEIVWPDDRIVGRGYWKSSYKNFLILFYKYAAYINVLLSINYAMGTL